jgi:hypothetical protein
VPRGWRLIKDSSTADRSFPNDGAAYRCHCVSCHRSFVGARSRLVCRSCEEFPPVRNQEDVQQSRVQADKMREAMMRAADSCECCLGVGLQADGLTPCPCTEAQP